MVDFFCTLSISWTFRNHWFQAPSHYWEQTPRVIVSWKPWILRRGPVRKCWEGHRLRQETQEPTVLRVNHYDYHYIWLIIIYHVWVLLVLFIYHYWYYYPFNNHHYNHSCHELAIKKYGSSTNHSGEGSCRWSKRREYAVIILKNLNDALAMA